MAPVANTYETYTDDIDWCIENEKNEGEKVAIPDSKANTVGCVDKDGRGEWRHNIWLIAKPSEIAHAG